MKGTTMTITTSTTAVVRAFAAEFAAAERTDAALRGLFLAHHTFAGSANAALAESRDGSQNLSGAERKARCIPNSASQVTGARFVGRVLATFDDDMFGSSWVRQAWDMASAIANEAKHGGGVKALSCLFGTDADTVSEVMASLERLDASVKANRRKAEAAERKAGQQSSESSEESDDSSDSSESEKALTLTERLAALVGPVNAVRDMMTAGTVASDGDRAQAQALIDALSSVLSPDTVVTIPNTVAPIFVTA